MKVALKNNENYIVLQLCIKICKIRAEQKALLLALTLVYEGVWKFRGKVLVLVALHRVRTVGSSKQEHGAYRGPRGRPTSRPNCYHSGN